MKPSWPQVPLSRALRQVEDVIILNDDQEYRQVTVSLHGRGLRLRRIVRGKDVKTKRQNRVHRGQFLYSRIDARNGAFGIVPEELDGAVVSGDFPAFEIDPTVADHRFIRYLSRSRWFVSQCEDPSRGVTNRQRMAERILLSMLVPLPPLDEQVRIVEKVEAVVLRIEEVCRLRETIEIEREEMLRSYAREIAKGAPCRALQEVAPITRRPVQIEKGTTYRELGVRSFGRGIFEKPVVQGDKWTWQRPYWMKAGDLLFSNIKAWEGAVGVVPDRCDGYVGSHRYITCRVEPTKATPEYLCHWFLTEDGLKYLSNCSPGATDRNRTLGLKKLMAIPVPVPPLEEQKTLTQLSARVATARESQRSVANELNDIVPALLDRAFRGELQ